MPGENGNVVIPGHRTVSPHPFHNIDQLRPGDAIVLVADNGRSVYQVTGSTIVAAEDGNVAEPTPDPVVTIYACHPKGSDAQRYVVFGRLVSSPADPPAPAKDAGQPQSQSQATPPANRDPSRPACGLVPCVRR
jgi:LPXTG-site transpeptidase (sortase) family protein